MSDFPVGYRSYHSNPSLNFELNRWASVLPESDLVRLGSLVETHADWKRLMLEEAERAECEERLLHAAFYCRAAEFFMDPSDPDKARTYDRFSNLFDEAVEGAAAARERIPYAGGSLPAMVLPARGEEKEVVLVHGGFDSFMEELFEWAVVLADAGYRVVLFEGPGQGAALRKSGLTMSLEWERPVAAVLDHLAIERCTIFGISLGGLLAPRAAAFEPRIRRVIACDVLDDFFDCFAHRSGRAVARVLKLLSGWRARATLNALLERSMRRDPDGAWALAHGMHVSGARDPFDFVTWLRSLRTASFSDRITQDFLLLAGREDHIVPLHQFFRQAQNLPNVRSFTGRIFGPAEQAQSHCQIGNVGLALAFVVSWLDFQLTAEARQLVPARDGPSPARRPHAQDPHARTHEQGTRGGA